MSGWYGKPYYSLDAYCKNTFHRKCYKIALNAHMTCPNRDGRIDTRGCIFCSAGGSGDFAVSTKDKSIEEQLEEGLAKFRGKFQGAGSAANLIAYFQAYTNTYAPVSYLEQIYRAALDCPKVCGISIATRPDCLPAEVLELLSALKTAYPEKFVWIELGLQTIHEKTAEWIRRGYTLPCFEEAFARLKEREIPVIVHLILGLPGETKEMMLDSVRYLNALQPFGVKLQLLHVLDGTDLGTLYRDHCLSAGTDVEPDMEPDRKPSCPERDLFVPKFAPAESDAQLMAHYRVLEMVHYQVLEKEEYLALLINCLRHLSPEIVVHRLTGDGAKRALIAPLWSADKRDVLNSLHKLLRETGAVQGDAL